MPNAPDPGSAPIFDLGAMIAQQRAGQQSTATDQPFVPLWKTKPATTPTAVGRLHKLDAMDKALGEPVSAPNAPNAQDYHTADYADSAFLDMTPADQNEFKTKAIRAGMIKEDATPAQIIQAWQNAVSQAEKYNKSRPADKDKWISPFEAIDKLGISQAAATGSVYDGFSRTVSSKQYNESEVKGNAIQAFQHEVGRDPTDAEVRAITQVINQQSTLHPTITTSQQYPASGNNAPFTATTSTGGIDPNQILLDQVRSSQEHANFDAAAVYYPAVLQALGALA